MITPRPELCASDQPRWGALLQWAATPTTTEAERLHVAGIRATALVDRGSYNVAIALLRECVAVAERGGHLHQATLWGTQLGRALLLSGDAAGAGGALDHALALERLPLAEAREADVALHRR